MGVRTPFSPMGALPRAASGGLPAGYTRLEWVSRGSAPYVDTGIIANDETGLSASFYRTNASAGVIVGTYGDGASNSGIRISAVRSNSQFRLMFYDYVTFVGENLSMVGKLLDASVNYLNSRLFHLDGYDDQAIVNSLPDSEYPISVFAVQNSNGVQFGQTYTRVYGLKITQGANIVRDYIPALDEEGVPCLFDAVTKTPYYGIRGTLGYG